MLQLKVFAMFCPRGQNSCWFLRAINQNNQNNQTNQNQNLWGQNIKLSVVKERLQKKIKALLV